MLRSNVLVPGSILLAALSLAPDPGVSQTPPSSPPSEETPQAQPAPSQPQAQQPQTPAAAPAQGAAAAEGTADSQAAEVAARVLQALGGKEAWDSTRYLRFTFAGRRRHYWDKFTGRHRLEGKTPQGQSFVVLSDLNSRQGVAFLDGKDAEGDVVKQMVDGAYAAWVNDTYWLLMPYKLRDPGVNLTYAGTEQIDGKTYDKLQLSFQNVGLTPGDRYWAYVNQQTNLIDRWAFVLQNQPADAQPAQWLWEGWQKYGNVMLAPMRTQVGGENKIEFTDLAVLDRLSDMVFDSPAAPAAP